MSSKIAPGIEEEQALREGGFTDEEVGTWRSDTTRELLDAGFSTVEVGEYFGDKNPDMSPMRKHFEAGFQKARAAEATAKTESGGGGSVPAPPVKPADGILQAIEAGWQMSVSGLISRGSSPDVVLPENAPMFSRIASQIGTLAGDVPAMVAGAVGGGAAGGAAGTATLPVIGTIGGGAIGAGAGAFAVPAAIRETLMQHYEKGDVKDFSDFWERSSAVLWETVKAGTVGALTAGVGGAAAKALGGAVQPAVRAAGVASAEIATMVTVGKALEGEMPQPQDFLEAAVLVGGLHGSARVAGKLRQIYAKTGMKPAEVIEASQKDPTVLQDLASTNVEVPKALEGLVEKVETKEPTPEPGPKTPPETKPDPILDRVVPSREPTREMSWDKLYTKVVDDLHPIKQFRDALAEGKELGVKDDPYALARLSRGAYGKADQFLELSPFDFKTLENTKSKPLKKILEPFKDDLDGLRKFAVASRTVELAARGIESGVPLEESAAAVREGKGRYGQAFQELVSFQNDTLAYLKDSGIVSEKAFEQMSESNKSYVPFFRLMDEGASGAKSAGKGLNVKNPVKKIEGSSRQIIDPIESIIKNTYLYVTLAERNRVLRSMADLAESTPGGEKLFERQKTPQKAIEVKAEEVAKFLEEHGIEGEAEAFTIFRPKSVPLAKDEIVVFRDGKRQVYKVVPELAEAVSALDRESAGAFFKILALPAQTLRAGSVLSPEFMARNLSRDMLTAFNLAEGAFTPLNTLSGLKSLFKKDEAYQSWLKSGGANSAMVAIDRNYISENIFKLSKETGVASRAWNVVKSPLEAMRVASELIENSTRLGEFKRVTNGDLSASAVFKGGMAAREVTLDFARVGAKTRAVNMITAFWNAHVQGLDKTVRALKERPIETGAKITASVTLPSVLLWYANHDDPRWAEIPRWQKDLFWIVMTDDHVYRIPKPNELGLIFGSLPERTLDSYFSENPSAFKDFGDSIVEAFTPSYLPTFAVPVVEQFANRSTFTGGPIVPRSLEGLLPEYQYTEYTTETTKALGSMVAAIPGQKSNRFASPAVIENYVRAWSGQLGMYALKLADEALIKAGAVPDPVKPAATLADIPVVKAFAIRYPSSSAQSIQDFYDRYAENKQVVDTIRHLAKSGDFKNMQKEFTLSANQDKLVALDGMKEALSNQSKFVRLIHKNPDISPEEKRQLIDGVYFSMIEIAKAGNKAMEEVAKTLKKD